MLQEQSATPRNAVQNRMDQNDDDRATIVGPATAADSGAAARSGDAETQSNGYAALGVKSSLPFTVGEIGTSLSGTDG